MEFRKYYTDFSTKEEKLLNTYLGKEYNIGEHTIIRQKEKIITKDEIQRAIKNGKIIEFHVKDDNKRILVRGNCAENGRYNICVVLDIDNNRVVTAYDNLVNDKHYTLDYSKYISFVNICGLLS